MTTALLIYVILNMTIGLYALARVEENTTIRALFGVLILATVTAPLVLVMGIQDMAKTAFQAITE